MACGTLKGRYSLDNSCKSLTQWIQAQGRTAEPAEVEVEFRLLQKTRSKRNWPSLGLGPRTVQWTEGIILSRWQGHLKVDGSQKRPAGAFFAAQFDIRDVLRLLFGFILIIKRVCTVTSRMLKSWSSIFLSNLMPTRPELRLQDEESLEVFNI